MRIKTPADCGICCILSFLWIASLSAYEGPKEKLHVYLLIGQSNMAGRASITKEESGPIAKTYLLDGDGKWEKAETPLNRYSTIRKSIKMQKLNPGFRFAQKMIEEDDSVSLGLVVNAKGGTSIKQWAKGTPFYDDAIKRTQQALKTGELKGILWHQGESDSGDGQYLEKLKTLIENLREDLGKPELPFVAGQLFYDPNKKANTKLVNDQLANLPGELPFTACVSSEGLTTYDNTHFDTKGMLLLGERYATEMLKIQASGKSGSVELNFLPWTNDQGNTIEAAFLELTPKGAKLKLKNGKEYIYPLEKFDAASQALARQLGG